MSPHDVWTKLVYDSAEGPPPFIYSIPREDKKRDEIDEGGLQVAKDVLIRDGRVIDATLDTFGFQLVNFETSWKTEKFYTNSDEIVKTYYKEIEECIKKYTGAKFVKCFEHQVRNKNKNSQRKNNEKDFSIVDYSYRVHADVTPENSIFYFARALEDQQPCCARGRYVYINAWRNITDDPVENNPLAVLDHASLTPGFGSEDYIDCTVYGYDAEKQSYFYMNSFHLNEKNSARHAWYYFPRMKKSEILLFKQFDSDPEQPKPTVFHTSFENPLVTTDSPVRQSIEVRSIAFFPDHEPNTCPSAWRIRWVRAKVRAFDFAENWSQSRTKKALTLLGMGAFIGALALGWRAWRGK